MSDIIRYKKQILDMGIDITIRGAIIGLLIVIWILGKVIRSTPNLYKRSKNEKGSESYGDLTILVGLRIMGILLFLGILIWVLTKLGYEYNSISDVLFAVFVALFVSGFCSFFILIITFIIAKLSKAQEKDKEIDLLDDKTNSN
jgi:hypothetical protein